MCKYSKGSWNCPYEKLPDSEYCIFHLEDENKNADEFNCRINELFDSKDQDINFIGFIFSRGTTIFNKKFFNKDIYKSFTFLAQSQNPVIFDFFAKNLTKHNH